MSAGLIVALAWVIGSPVVALLLGACAKASKRGERAAAKRAAARVDSELEAMLAGAA